MSIIKTLVVLYLFFAVLFFLVSNVMMFHPPAFSPPLPGDGWITLSLQNGTKISALYLPYNNAKYSILFSHGNGEDLIAVKQFLSKLRDQGYNVLSYDYAGYGASEGTPNEQNTYQAIDAAYYYLTNQLKTSPSDIVLYGRSIGTGPTIDLAARMPSAGVILESPFISAYRAVTVIPLFPFDKFKNIDKVGKIKAPILVLQGDQDEVIPHWHGKKIFDAIQSRKKAYWIPGAHHNDIVLVAQNTYWETINQFIATLGSHNAHAPK